LRITSPFFRPSSGLRSLGRDANVSGRGHRRVIATLSDVNLTPVREAADRPRDGDPELPAVDLARYDALFEVPA
jgi:hypothetical protein